MKKKSGESERKREEVKGMEERRLDRVGWERRSAAYVIVWKMWRREEDGTLNFLGPAPNDISFPPGCDDGIKIKKSSSDIKPPSARSDNRHFGFTFGLQAVGNA